MEFWGNLIDLICKIVGNILALIVYAAILLFALNIYEMLNESNQHIKESNEQLGCIYEELSNLREDVGHIRRDVWSIEFDVGVMQATK